MQREQQGSGGGDDDAELALFLRDLAMCCVRRGGSRTALEKLAEGHIMMRGLHGDEHRDTILGVSRG